jgi:hypothetical protein
MPCRAAVTRSPFLACKLLTREQSLDIGEVIDEVWSVRLRQK